jgi:hypothetical protein
MSVGVWTIGKVMKFRILILVLLSFCYCVLAHANSSACHFKVTDNPRTICVFENTRPSKEAHFLVLPKLSKARNISINGNTLLKDQKTFYQNLSGLSFISKFAYPIPEIYLNPTGHQELVIEWDKLPAADEVIEIKTNIRSAISKYFLFVPTFFAFLFVLVIFFIKKDFEKNSFNFALVTGFLLTIYLYLNSSHAYLEYPEYTNLILKFHVLIISFSTIFLIGLADKFFGFFKNRLYLFTPAITLALLLFTPGFKGDDQFIRIVMCIIPNALVTTIASGMIIYKLLFDKKYKNDITYIPIILTGFVTVVLALVDTYVSSFDAFTEPPMCGYGLLLCYITIVMCFIIKNKKMRISNLVVHEQVSEISRQVAHDIRSPLAALKIQLSSLHELSGEKQNFLKDCVFRINEILNDLEEGANEQSHENEIHSVQISSAVDQVISEKLLEYKNIRIENTSPKSSANLVSGINQSTFQRMISNLINNSIEASKGDGAELIKVEITDEDLFVKITVQDNGTGIPESVINKVFDKEFTYNKKGGKGLGLSHLKEHVNKWQGKLTIESVINIGTTISFTIPKFSQNYVLIDDEELMRLGWTIKSLEQKINFKSYASFEDFKEDFLKDEIQFEKDTIFYIDYELLGNIKGTDIAKKIHSYGFLNIYICSGHESLDIRAYPFIKGVVPKNFNLF